MINNLSQGIFPFIGIDIGGTLAKICFSVQKNRSFQIENLESLKITHQKSFDILFNIFKTDEIDKLVKFIKDYNLNQSPVVKIFVTGGGAYKFYDLFKEELQIEIEQVNEFESLSKGLEFVDKYHSNLGVFYYSKEEGRQNVPNSKHDQKFPILLANIGSGASFIKFNDINNYERISGTCIGGGTFLGLCNLITGNNDFEELLRLSNQGNTKNIDLFITDIYQGSEDPIHSLKSNSLAVSLGKISNVKEIVNKEDIVKSLLHLIAYNIAQVVYLYAEINQIERVYFTGNFIRNHEDTMDCITYAFKHFTPSGENKNFQRPMFLKHDGFLGALGCFLQSFEQLKSKLRRQTTYY